MIFSRMIWIKLWYLRYSERITLQISESAFELPLANWYLHQYKQRWRREGDKAREDSVVNAVKIKGEGKNFVRSWSLNAGNPSIGMYSKWLKISKCPRIENSRKEENQSERWRRKKGRTRRVAMPNGRRHWWLHCSTCRVRQVERLRVSDHPWGGDREVAPFMDLERRLHLLEVVRFKPCTVLSRLTDCRFSTIIGKRLPASTNARASAQWVHTTSIMTCSSRTKNIQHTSSLLLWSSSRSIWSRLQTCANLEKCSVALIKTIEKILEREWGPVSVGLHAVRLVP